MPRKFVLLIILASLGSLWGCQSDTAAPIADLDSELTPGPTEDTTAPVATILPLEVDQLSLQFELEFEAEDDASGVASVEIFVRTPDLIWTSLGFYNQSPVTYLASVDGPHSFYGVAVDSAGNRQNTPKFAQAETMVPVPIIITDRRGEDFDITNAVLRYFMQVHGWGYGLGRDTIRPINDPVFYVSGQHGYPDSNSVVDIMAVNYGGESHAYGIGDITNREVVNDVLGDVHFSATY